MASWTPPQDDAELCRPRIEDQVLTPGGDCDPSGRLAPLDSFDPDVWLAPIPGDGYADGGTPYSDDELAGEQS